jgi:hypothetical protein
MQNPEDPNIMGATITEITTGYTTENPTKHTNTTETHKLNCPEIQKMEKNHNNNNTTAASKRWWGVG